MELFKEIIPAILQHKPEVFDNPEAEKVYTPFMVNRALSYHIDCIFYANQINQYYQLDKSLQIDFLLNTIRANRRPFVPWAKIVKDEDLSAVKSYYGYSNRRALEALKILTEEQITLIKERINTGE
jgi:hypothetical protein